MLVPVKWLKKYVDIDETTREIANRVTASGSHVESINTFDGISNIVVAKVLDVRKHENADKLSLVDLDFGDKETVVTGAKNMKPGDHVVYAKLGATLPGGITLGEKEFQGIKSKGMLLSYEELGVSENLVPKNSEDGIIILSDEIKEGTDALEALDLDDSIIEFEITPNRPDCLSILGMAREVASVFDKKIQEPSLEVSNKDGEYLDYFNGVKLETENINRFLTAVVKDVEIKESPIYIQNFLRNAGIRPINNIVDFTNFIMLEYGQPLHAYDLDTIEGNSLIVRDGKNGDVVKTIDQTERKIEDGDIVIADGNSNPIGLGGVMGGFDTEVTQNTKNILIEAASFNGESIRKTSKRLALKSEASSRFEKGVPAKLSEFAINRFLKLVEETNSGTIVNGIDGLEDFKDEERVIELRNARSNSLLGLDLSVEESRKYLEALDLETSVEGDVISVKVPYFRDDLVIEADLIEEIGRLYGFHNIAPKPLVGELTEGLKSDLRMFTDKVRQQAYALGFSEIMTYSFISNKQYDKLNLDENDKLRESIEIMNPLGEDFSVMRTTLIGNMLEAIRKNLNNRQTDLRFSEVGNTFKLRDGQSSEEKLLDMSLVGNYEYYDLKESFEKLLDKLNISEYRFEREENNPIFHTGRCANITIEGNVVATIGEINPIVLDNFDIEKRVLLLEANLNKLFEYSKEIKRYEKISKYPMVERDIAFVIDKEVESQAILDVIKENGSEYLKFVNLFDVYSGSQIEEGKVSLAYKIGFQSNEFTLKDEIVKETFENIVKGLESNFDIDLRS